MKTPVYLILLMVAFLSPPIQKSTDNESIRIPTTNQEKTYGSVTERTPYDAIINTLDNQKKKKRKKKLKEHSAKVKKHKDLAYRVISSAPTLSYSIIRVGDGDRVIFSINNGNVRIPGSVIFEHDSGVPRYFDLKKRFVNVTFPFTCSLYTPISYSTNPFNNMPSRLNGFKIEIYKPGIWEISFHR